jgi:hypothetical protein
MPTSSWWTGELEPATGNITRCVRILESWQLRLRGEAIKGNSMCIKVLCMWCLFYRVPQQGRCNENVPEDAGFLCDKAAVVGDTIKGTLCTSKLSHAAHDTSWPPVKSTPWAKHVYTFRINVILPLLRFTSSPQTQCVSFIVALSFVAVREYPSRCGLSVRQNQLLEERMNEEAPCATSC